MSAAKWTDVQDRAAVPGSAILTAWKAERDAIRNAGHVYPSSAGTSGSQLYEWLSGGYQSAAGAAVTERTAMSVAAVYACIGLIGGAVSSLPLPIYMRTPDGRERVDHELWWLLNEQPCARMSAAVMWEYLIWSLLLHGDAIALIRRQGARIIGFDPIHPQLVNVNENDDRLAYTVTGATGQGTYDQDDVLHVPGLGFDGKRGLSPLRYAARQAIGIALAADEYSARFFSNGARPDYIITTDTKLDTEQAKIFRESWMARYAGAQNAHIPAILSGPGADVKALNLSPEEAQLMATRNFQAGDVARIYGVPPHMIGITDKSTSWGTGIEQQSIGFVKYTLSRHLVKIEQEINRKCFRSAKYFAEFATIGLERGDTKGRNEGYRIALGRSGEQAWMTVDEVRKAENLPPMGGDAAELSKNMPEPANEPANDPKGDA